MIGNVNTKFYDNIEYNKKYINDNIYKIRVIDYDGTLIDGANLNSGQEYTLPQAPTHPGLVFQEWSSTRTITNNKIQVGDGNILVGAIYTTSSGKNEFDIELNENTGLSVTLKLGTNKDWGDGVTNTSNTHTYSDYGKYTIKCNGTTITRYVFDQSSTNINYYVKHIRLANITSMEFYAFSYCYSLETIITSNSLTNYNSISNCHSLKTVILPSGVKSLSIRTFEACYSLTNIVLPIGITKIDAYDFSNCRSLTNIIMPSSLTTLNDFNIFSTCYALMEYDFRYHTTVPTLNYSFVFTNINNVWKIKVPFNLYYDWINAPYWKDIKDHIISTGSATINFTGDNTGNIFVNNDLILGTSITWNGSAMPYYVYDYINNIVLPTQTVTGIVNGSTQNVNIDLSSKKKITISTGVNGLTAIFTIDGKTYSATEDNGNYSIYVVGSGINVNYYINGGDNYCDEEGSIITTGSNITESVTLTAATTSSWIRPDLTDNGTLGGDTFAVSAEAYTSSTSYQAWRAVDSNTSTSYYWYSKSGGGNYIFYNPDAIKVTELTYKYTSTSYRGTNVMIQGSNDNTNWESIESTYSGSSTTYTSTIINPKYYRYYKLNFTVYSTYIRLYDMLITATIRVPA